MRAQSVFCQIHLKVLIDEINSRRKPISLFSILSNVSLFPLAIIKEYESNIKAEDIGCRKIRILLQTVLARDDVEEYKGDLINPKTPYTF